MTVLLGAVFGYFTMRWVMDFGDKRGWSTGKQFALMGALILIAAVPIALLAKLIEKAFA